MDLQTKHESFSALAQAIFSAPGNVAVLAGNVPASLPRADLSANGQGLPRVLVAESIEYHLRRVSLMLRRMGFDCLAASTGADALRAVEASQPAVVLLDWSLPHENGLVIAHAIRRMAVAQPFVIGTALHLSPEIRELALRTGFDAFCEKPVALPVLGACLRGAGFSVASDSSWPTNTPDFGNVRRLARGNPERTDAVVRAFLRDLRAESHAVVEAARIGGFPAVGERAEKLLWRASLVGDPDFIELIRAIQSAAEAGESLTVEELCQILDLESHRVAGELQTALCEEPISA